MVKNRIGPIKPNQKVNRWVVRHKRMIYKHIGPNRPNQVLWLSIRIYAHPKLSINFVSIMFIVVDRIRFIKTDWITMRVIRFGVTESNTRVTND